MSVHARSLLLITFLLSASNLYAACDDALPVTGARDEGVREQLRLLGRFVVQHSVITVRRAMDANMTRAHTQVVPASVTDEADIGDWPAGTDATARLLRAVARACALEPALNASYLGRDRGRRLNDTVDVGIAVDTEDGLFVPVLRDVAHRDAADLRGGLDAMHADIVARTVPPEHLRGATITLSNFGSIGGRHAALVIVPPQVAIIGAGRAYDAAAVHEGQLAIRRLLPVSLTFDHRVVMGGEATRCLNARKLDLEAST